MALRDGAPFGMGAGLMGTRTKKIQSWRVEKFDRKQVAWIQQCVHDDRPAALVCCGALLNHGYNARVRSFMKTVLVADPPVGPETAAQRHRQSVAMQMSDRADALKRYKSPG
jgi:hypothetical protein